MKGDFPYLTFLEVLKKCRRQLVDDTLNGSEDLYDALYSNIHSEIFNTKMELYELIWIELHWSMLIDVVAKKADVLLDKKEVLKMFAKWYEQFVSNWEYTELDALVFEEKKSILQTLISVNNEWEQNLKKMKVSFEQSKKILKNKIKELQMER